MSVPSTVRVRTTRPLRRRHPLLGHQMAVFTTDVALILVTGAAALVGRDVLTFLSPAVGLDDQLGVVGPVSLVGWILTIAVMGGYRSEVFGAGTEEFKRVAHASFVTAGAVGIGCYLAKYQFARGFFLLTFLVGPLLLLIGRWLSRQALHAARRRGHAQLQVVVAGTADSVDAMARVLRREKWLGMSVMGAVLPTGDVPEETPSGIPTLGTMDRLTDIADWHRADLVIFTSGSLRDSFGMRQAIWALERNHVQVALEPRLEDISHDRISIRPMGGTPLIQVDSPTWMNAGALGKRCFDIVGATVALLLLSPLFLVAALAIWRDDRGPLTFRHLRVGRDGALFHCLKFRTMRADADEWATALQEQSGQTALLFKMKDDPRVTPPGRWLRRFSIDELPQLVNVLRGDMSLVGPRPQVDREVALYDEAMARRLLVRPGMTGLWQVSGRNDLTPQEAMRLDVFYVDNWSMLQDLAIMARTVRAVLSSKGAY